MQQHLQQQRYQQMQQQQQARQALMAQQAAYPGMPMGMPMGQVTPQQFAAIRSMQQRQVRVSPPPLPSSRAAATVSPLPFVLGGFVTDVHSSQGQPGNPHVRANLGAGYRRQT